MKWGGDLLKEKFHDFRGNLDDIAGFGTVRSVRGAASRVRNRLP
jgi:hypothetical protein